MKALVKIIIIAFVMMLQISGQSQNCAALSGIINTYAPVTAISGNVVTRGATTGALAPFAVGDFVVLIQMTGPPPGQAGSNIGNYELRSITAVSGNNITLDGIVNSYTTSEKVQIVRAPYCPAGTVSATVTAKGWDGITGGIIALKGNILTLNADIDASGSGFNYYTWPSYGGYSALSGGLGSADGRGLNGTGQAGKGGGGIGGGGGAGGFPQFQDFGRGGSIGNGGTRGSDEYGNPGVNGVGLNGGIGFGTTDVQGKGFGSGGGGGVIGGGGGGGGGAFGLSGGGGGGGGVTGGGGGGDGAGGGGGVKGVGIGGNASCQDGCGGAGGGSYGGGGGGASSFSGGDDSQAGGGGGSWSGGGIAGFPGQGYSGTGGAGNLPVSVEIDNLSHYLNITQPKLMLGGAGGNSQCQIGGFGGGIVIMDFNSVSGNNFSIRSNGEPKGLAINCFDPNVDFEAFRQGIGAAGGGAGGQMTLNIKNFTSNTNIEAKGGKGGDGNSNNQLHGGVGGAGGGGGGIWIYGSSMKTNTGSNTITINNTNLLAISAGSGSATIVGGGNRGGSTTNPKNGYYTGVGGAGGNGLIVQSPDALSWGGSCSISLTAVAGSCTPATNQYSVTGTLTFTDAPASGTLTVSDGAITQVFTAPFTSPQAYTLSGLTADGVSHTVTAVFSEDAACTNTMMYTAPISCAACSLSLTTSAGACVPATNTYSVSGNLNFSNAPSTGTLTVSIGAVNQIFTAPFTSPQAFTLSGLVADGVSHTAVAVFSADGNCTNMSSYTAPVDCTPACAVAVTAISSVCNSSNNQYFINGTITFSNAPSTGSLIVSVSGGGSQTFALPQTSPLNYTINGLNADGAVHTVTVTFSNDPTCTNTTTYTAPASCSAPCPPSNYSMCTGESYTLTAPTGYSGYQWYTVVGVTETPISGANTNILVVTAAGTYIWKATDGGNCPIGLCCPVTVQVVSPVVSCSVVTSPGCSQSNGSATVVASGGNGAPYTYVWSSTPTQTLATATNLAAGTYTVTVTDGGMCTATCSVVLTNPGGPMAMISNVSPGCGQSNGSATVVASGGISPYTYVWSTTPVQNNPTATSLSAGTYTVTVVDNSNCSVTISTTLVNPNGPSATCSNTAPGCGLANGTATVSPSGGVGPYTYIWSTFPVQTGITAIGISAGTYTVTVTDNSNCSTTCSTTLTAPGGPQCLLAANTQPSCADLNGGSVTVSGAGGTAPYTFQWSNGQGGTTATGLSGGIYTVTVTDANNCSSTCTGALTTPMNCCNINAVTAFDLECLDNGTPNKITDNRIRFRANVTNTNLSLTGYNVTVNGGTTITPNTNVAYGITQFTLGAGTAGGGSTFTVTVTDSATPGCMQTFQVVDPGNCTPAIPECPPVKCGTATIQVNNN